MFSLRVVVIFMLRVSSIALLTTLSDIFISPISNTNPLSFTSIATSSSSSSLKLTAKALDSASFTLLPKSA